MIRNSRFWLVVALGCALVGWLTAALGADRWVISGLLGFVFGWFVVSFSDRGWL